MKGDTIYQKNLNILKVRFPLLYRTLRNPATESVSCEIMRAETGEPALKVEHAGKKLFFHSRRNPRAEAEEFIESSTDGTEQIIILVGFGLGYHVEAILKRNKNVTILVIEPEGTLIKEALKSRDLSPVLASERVLLFLWGTPVPYEEVFGIHSPKLILLRPYCTLFGEQVKEIQKEFSNYLNRTEINIATLKRFDRLWTKNTFKNAARFFQIPGILGLQNLLEGVATAVICAGPSLEEDVGTLKCIREQVVIIAVDTALKPLLKRDIRPDFVITVDPQYINSFFTSHAGLHPPPLIADPAVYPAVLRGYPGMIFLTSSVFSPGSYIEQFSGKKGAVAAGGSVAVAAFDMARILGSDPIIMLGLDLSYGGGRTHVSGSVIEEYVLSRMHRFESSGNYYVQYIRSGDPTPVKDKQGKRVYTDRRLLLYKKWFENQRSQNGRRVINAASGGLRIEGFEHKSLSDLLKDIKGAKPDREALERRLEELQNLTKVEEKRLIVFIQYLLSLNNSLHRLQTLCSKGREISKKLLDPAVFQPGVVKPAVVKPVNLDSKNRNSQEIEEQSRLMKALSQIDREIADFKEENQLLSMVLQSSINEILRKTAATDRHQALQNSLGLYTSMEEGLHFLHQLLDGAIKKLMILQAPDEDSSKAGNLL